MKSWAVSVLAALLGGCRARTASRPLRDVTPPRPTLGAEASLCPLGSPLVSEPPPPSSVGLALSIAPASADDVLRRAFPATFPASVSAEYLEAWIDATFSAAPAVEPAYATCIERDWWAARRTAFGLGGCWSPHNRGVA